MKILKLKGYYLGADAISSGALPSLGLILA
jgi:hypothetical protein